MALASFEEILKLSAAERIQLAEQIWESLRGTPHLVPCTDAQRAELDMRFADAQANPDVESSWAEAKERLINRK